MPAVEDKVTLSASQISTFQACRRKWAWGYVAGIRGEPNASAQLGSRVHEILEAYLRGEGWDLTGPEGEIAQSALEHLPEPKTGDVEASFLFEKDGIRYQGFKDFRRLVPDRVTVAEVWDHKTTSDFRWAKTPEDLATDPQAVLYAVDEFVTQPVDYVDLFWSYMRTKGARKSRLVHLRMSPEHAAEEFSKLHAVGKDIAAHYTEGLAAQDKSAYVLSLEPNLAHCDAYGGCPHKDRCGFGPFKGTQMASIEETMSRLRAAAGTPEPGPQPEAKSTGPVNPPEAALAPKPEPKKAKKTKQVEGPTLYLDCMPLGGEHTFFDDLVREAAKRIHASHGVGDYRFIDFKGSGVLLATVQTILDEMAPTSIVVRDASTPEALICSSALVARAGLVVVGT